MLGVVLGVPDDSNDGILVPAFFEGAGVPEAFEGAVVREIGWLDPGTSLEGSVLGVKLGNSDVTGKDVGTRFDGPPVLVEAPVGMAVIVGNADLDGDVVWRLLGAWLGNSDALTIADGRVVAPPIFDGEALGWSENNLVGTIEVLIRLGAELGTSEALKAVGRCVPLWLAGKMEGAELGCSEATGAWVLLKDG